MASPRPAPGEMLSGAGFALEQHVRSSDLGADITRNVFQALRTDGRLLQSEDSAALATLVLLSHESAGGERPDRTYPAVVAMECLMAAGDLLDDIQDDELVQKGWESPAVAAETMAALLVLAHSSLSTTAAGSEDSYARALSRLVRFETRALRGQSVDVRTDFGSVTHAEALEISRAKSGALGRCAAEMGASIASSNDQVITDHGDFGEHIAVVFQLMNDIAGIWPDEAERPDAVNARPTPPLQFLSRLTRDQAAPAVGQQGAVRYTWALASTELARARRKAHQIETWSPSSRLGFLLQR